MNKRLATPTNHLSESLKNLQGTKKMVWFEFQMNGRCTTLLKPKGRHLITLFKNCFLFSRNHKLPWRHEYKRVFWHFFLWPWLWLSFLCFQPEQEPDKSSLCLIQRSNTKTAEQVRCYWRPILFQVLDTVAIYKVLPKQDFALCQQFNI